MQRKIFPQHRHVIRHFTPNWFAVCMGTGVFALLLNQLHLPVLGAAIWRGNMLLFGLFSLLYAARWLIYPREAALIFSHPVMPMFLGAIPMGLATIVNGFIVFAHTAPVGLWGLDACLAVLACMGVPLAMFTRQRHSLEGMTAVWLLPIVPAEVAAASAGLLAPHLPAASAMPVIMAGYVLWALSVPLALGVLGILFLRLALHKLPAPEMAVSSWLALGPLGTAALALLLLGHAASAGFAPELADAGHVAQGLGLVGGLVFWGYGAWWLLMAVAMTLCYLPRNLPFNLGWWGFTFPLGVFILATQALAAQTGLILFTWLATGLSVAFALIWTMVALRTLAGAWQGRLFAAPCLASLEAGP